MTPIRWGIIAPGKIARKFTEAVAKLPDARIEAVASRDSGRARAFAEQHGIPRHYEGYERLVADPAIDMVYVASPHPFHAEHSIMALEAGKPVLCEKPVTINESQFVRVVNAARARRVFFMEAMWTRFLPAIVQTREWITSGAIGDVRMMTASFGFRAKPNPESRLFAPELGGGGLLDVGVYVVSLASMVMNGTEPGQVVSMAHMAPTGVDGQAGILLDYGNQRMAVLTCGVETATNHDAWIYGTKGMIHLPAKFWSSQRATLIPASGESQTFEQLHEINGFEYQIREAMQCVRKGLTESPLMPPGESLHVMRTLDRIRAPWGWRYPME